MRRRPSPRSARAILDWLPACRSLSCWTIVEHVVGDAADQRVGRLLGGHAPEPSARSSSDDGPQQAAPDGMRVATWSPRVERLTSPRCSSRELTWLGPSAALLYRNWPISFSSTTADCVSLRRVAVLEHLRRRRRRRARCTARRAGRRSGSRRWCPWGTCSACRAARSRAATNLSLSNAMSVDAPDQHAGALHRRAHLEPADVVELGRDTW